MLGQFVQTNGRTAVLFGQCPATLQRAVGNGHLARLVGAEMGRTQFDHFASTDENDALRLDRFENALRQMHPCRSHGYDVGANRRRAAHFLCH